MPETYKLIEQLPSSIIMMAMWDSHIVNILSKANACILHMLYISIVKYTCGKYLQNNVSIEGKKSITGLYEEYSLR